jgi:hypothetical protein
MARIIIDTRSSRDYELLSPPKPEEWRAVHGGDRFITKFDTSHTGQGIDQYGSGFYFAQRPDTALQYGPILTEATITLNDPIILNADPEHEQDSIHDVILSDELTRQLLKAHPYIGNLAGNETHPNPLEDWNEDIWDTQSPAGDLTSHPRFDTWVDQAVRGTQWSLLMMEHAYGEENRDYFNRMLTKHSRRDGILVKFPDEYHIIAWNPTQISDITHADPWIARHATPGMMHSIEVEPLTEPRHRPPSDDPWSNPITTHEPSLRQNPEPLDVPIDPWAHPLAAQSHTDAIGQETERSLSELLDDLQPERGEYVGDGIARTAGGQPYDPVSGMILDGDTATRDYHGNDLMTTIQQAFYPHPADLETGRRQAQQTRPTLVPADMGMSPGA